MGNKRRMTGIIVLLVMLFCGGVYYLYTLMTYAGDRWPVENEPGSLTSSIRSLEGENARLRQEIAKIPAAEEQLAKLKVEFELATRVLPRENAPSQLIAAIHTKALQSGVMPDRLTPSVIRAPGAQRGRAGGGEFEEWSFSLQIRGNYDQIATFVNRMEEFESSDASRTGSEKRFFQVTSIDITSEANGMSFLLPPPGSGSDARKGHTCTLVMSTYRFTGQE